MTTTYPTTHRFVWFKQAVRPYLTYLNARAYAATTEKWLFVVNTILDDMELHPHHDFVRYIEDQLDALGDAADADEMLDAADGFADDEVVLFRGERITAGLLREKADALIDA